MRWQSTIFNLISQRGWGSPSKWRASGRAIIKLTKKEPCVVHGLSVFVFFRELRKIWPPTRKKTGGKLWAGPPNFGNVWKQPLFRRLNDGDDYRGMIKYFFSGGVSCRFFNNIKVWHVQCLSDLKVSSSNVNYPTYTLEDCISHLLSIQLTFVLLCLLLENAHIILLATQRNTIESITWITSWKNKISHL
jgi:hypothetical protein